ncbi:MAG: hypothetical protein E4H40_07995, partial [Candidatus Brocadiia bacterium]
MFEAFESKLRRARIRCSINVFFEQAVQILICSGIAVFSVVMIEKLLAFTVITPATAWRFCSTAVVLILFLWLYNHPSRRQVSLLVDERLKLRERFSSAMALADSPNPFAQAACLEARERAKQIRVDSHFPVKLSRKWV